jgi:hypothetical protein
VPVLKKNGRSFGCVNVSSDGCGHPRSSVVPHDNGFFYTNSKPLETGKYVVTEAIRNPAKPHVLRVVLFAAIEVCQDIEREEKIFF